MASLGGEPCSQVKLSIECRCRPVSSQQEAVGSCLFHFCRTLNLPFRTLCPSLLSFAGAKAFHASRPCTVASQVEILTGICPIWTPSPSLIRSSSSPSRKRMEGTSIDRFSCDALVAATMLSGRRYYRCCRDRSWLTSLTSVSGGGSLAGQRQS